jgi:hypothetical protein
MMRPEEHNERRRVRARRMALLLGVFAAGVYLAYIAFSLLSGGA